MDDERATGRFDEDGNYYWNDEKDKDGTRREKGDDAEDAWLKGAEVLEGEKHEAAMRARRERERRRATRHPNLHAEHRITAPPS